MACTAQLQYSRQITLLFALAALSTMFPFIPPQCRRRDSLPSWELRCRLMDSQDLGDLVIPLLDCASMPDFDTSSKFINSFIDDGCVFSSLASVFTASQKVCCPPHSSTYLLFLSTLVNSSRHQESVYQESSSPTMLSVSIILWSPYQGFDSRSSVILGLCFYCPTGLPYISDVSQEISEDSLIWLSTLDSSFFSQILLSLAELQLKFLLPLRSNAGWTFRLSAFLIFLRGVMLFTIFGMPQLSQLQAYFETECVSANLREGMSPDTEAEISTPCVKRYSLMGLLSISSMPRQLSVRSSSLTSRSWLMVSLRSQTRSSVLISYSSSLFLMISFTTTSYLLSSSSLYYKTCSIELEVMPRSSMLSSLGSIFAPRQNKLILAYSWQFKAFVTS